MSTKEEGVSVLLVEQNANMALSIADRGYVLETGQIILEGTGKELIVMQKLKKFFTLRVNINNFYNHKMGNLIEIPFFYCFLFIFSIFQL